MIPIGRTGAALAVCGVAAILLQLLVIEPYWNNRLLKTVKVRTNRATKGVPTTTAAIARRNLEDLAKCGQWCSGRAEVLLIEAANERILGRSQRTRELYATSLDMERRVNTLMLLGLLELELGRRDDAIAAFVAAAEFGFNYTELIPDYELANRVRAIVRKRAASSGELDR